MTTSTLQFARVEDAREILALYSTYIDTAITFELEVPSLEDFSQRIASISQHYPYLICKQDDANIGYAYAHKFKERPAYQWDAELSIYLDSRVHTRGLGKQMYLCLIDILRIQRVHNVYGIVTLPNEKSQRLHESLGFSPAGVMHRTGFKNGAWRDVAWFEKTILPYEDEPRAFLPINMIDNKLTASILEAYTACINA